MATADARSAWLWGPKFSFVQEDAEKAPKLFYSPSHSFKRKSDSKVGDLTNRFDQSKSDHNANFNMSDDKKWRLHLQLGNGHEKDFTNEHLKSLGTQHEVLNAEFSNQTTEIGCFPHPMDDKLWYPDDQSIQMAFLNSLDSGACDKLSLEYETNLIGAEKVEPWWRMADKDELACLVAQKSLEYVENCDLPQPQLKHFRKAPFSPVKIIEHNGIPVSTLDQKLSSNRAYGTGTTDKDRGETKYIPESDLSKGSLLDALRCSQTRARKAKEEAQKLQIEKEHIIKLFFKQASQLFAYRQWLHILQLEGLCFPLGKNMQPVLPRVPRNDDAHRKILSDREGLPKPRMSKSLVAVAVGLSLAGVGLLLAWTTDCLCPALRWCYPYVSNLLVSTTIMEDFLCKLKWYVMWHSR